MANEEIVSILENIAGYLEMSAVPFKPQAYRRAAQAVGGLAEDVGEIYREGGLRKLEEIPGVGVSIAEKIEEFLKTGRVKSYEELRKKIPVDLDSFKAVLGLGPKSILKLYKKLKIKNLADLEKAAARGEIKKLSGFGQKSEENILRSLAFVKKNQGRFILGFTMPLIQEIESRLKDIIGVEKVIVAGSVRRRKETIGDVDVLAVAKKSGPIMDYFVKMPEVARVLAKGETKSSVQLRSGLEIDLRVVPAGSYGAALNYFTGSKAHNIALREIAVKKGYKLNEYGLFSTKDGSPPGGKAGVSGGKGWKQIAGRNEEEVYRALGLVYIEPEMREDSGEIESAEKRRLPELVSYNDLRGDLQVQTDWTDGQNSITEMVEAAQKAGLEYIAITDHTKHLAMTHGLDEKMIQKQWQEIDRVNRKLKNENRKLTVLKGTECDILKDGRLDLPEKILARLDFVGVSVHSYFNLSREEQTERIIKAIRNKHVDMLFHPTGRIINRRAAYEVDMERLIETAKETGTVLEIDSIPDRLDLKDEYIRKCVQAGVMMSIDSDAHAVKHFSYLEYGLAEARRGWAERKNIINAWPLAKMKKFLKNSGR